MMQAMPVEFAAQPRTPTEMELQMLIAELEQARRDCMWLLYGELARQIAEKPVRYWIDPGMTFGAVS